MEKYSFQMLSSSIATQNCAPNRLPFQLQFRREIDNPIDNYAKQGLLEGQSRLN